MKTALQAFTECAYARGQHGNSNHARQHASAWAEHPATWERPRSWELVAKLQRESAIKCLVHGLALYIDSHQMLFGSPVGEDGYCDEYVKDIAKAVIALLSAESGRLDCGTIDHAVREMARVAGIDLET